MTGSTAFLILADETAIWRIAGLSNLDRLVLALNEWAETAAGQDIIDAVIFWRPDAAISTRWLPRHPRITRIRLTESVRSIPSAARVLHTRLFPQRGGLVEFLETAAPVLIEGAPEETSNSWSELSARFSATARTGSGRRPLPPWIYLDTPADVTRCEKGLLRRTGKSQDGVVSRFVNRPLSRTISRFFLRYEITPTMWTLWTFLLPVVGFVFLATDEFAGIVAGAFVFQLYSVVDGCDGEIARATYQESERGGRIDDFLDMVGSILYVLGLGLGLFRSRSSLYLLEGLLCAAVIAVNEWALHRIRPEAQVPGSKITEALYPRHRRLLGHPGLGKLNQTFLWWIIQFTKRDTAILAFLILALLNQSPWILHLWLSVSGITLLLSAGTRRGQSHVVQSRA